MAELAQSATSKMSSHRHRPTGEWNVHVVSGPSSKPNFPAGPATTSRPAKVHVSVLRSVICSHTGAHTKAEGAAEQSRHQRSSIEVREPSTPAVVYGRIPHSLSTQSSVCLGDGEAATSGAAFESAAVPRHVLCTMSSTRAVQTTNDSAAVAHAVHRSTNGRAYHAIVSTRPRDEYGEGVRADDDQPRAVRCQRHA
jgi:hypothetical protein